MVWFTIWFMVILKIPILYLAWVIWWAVKDPPEAYAGAVRSELGGDDGGPGWRPRTRDRRRGRRGGPHGTSTQRGARVRRSRARATR